MRLPRVWIGASTSWPVPSPLNRRYLMRWQIPLVVALALFVAVSCDQQPVEPAADQVAEAPAFNFMKGPDNPGQSGVFRGLIEDCWWCTTVDGDGYLVALHNQADDMVPCGGSSGFYPWDAQLVENNSGQLYKQQAYDVPLFIYDWGDFWTACTAGPEVCCPFREEEWLYQGTHDMVAVDNWQDNRWYVQFMANGVVYDHDGVQYHYREHQKQTSEHGWTHEEIIVH